MDFRALKLRSLKTRVTLGTLALFLGGMWSLAFYASHILREDMQRMSGEQQLSTATYIAAATNDELGLRLRALEEVAAHIPQELMDKPSSASNVHRITRTLSVAAPRLHTSHT